MHVRPGSSGVRRAGAARRRRGSATVEFALVAPLLTTLVLGTVELTRAVQVKDVLTDAVRSGCRLAILPGTSTATVKANVNQILTNAGITAPGATITVQVNGTTADAGTAVQGDQISVKVAVPISQVGWLTPLFYSNLMVESETLVMMRQG